MANAIKVDIVGGEAVVKLFNEIGAACNDFQLRNILAAQGRVVVKQIRANVTFPGKIGQQFKRDLAVRKNRFVPGKPNVDVGSTFTKFLDNKETQSHSGNKIAIIAAHMTEGFNQHPRVNAKGKSTGKVRQTYPNPVTAGFRQSEQAMMDATNKEIKKQLEKVKRKNSQLVK